MGRSPDERATAITSAIIEVSFQSERQTARSAERRAGAFGGSGRFVLGKRNNLLSWGESRKTVAVVPLTRRDATLSPTGGEGWARGLEQHSGCEIN